MPEEKTYSEKVAYAINRIPVLHPGIIIINVDDNKNVSVRSNMMTDEDTNQVITALNRKSKGL